MLKLLLAKVSPITIQNSSYFPNLDIIQIFESNGNKLIA